LKLHNFAWARQKSITALAIVLLVAALTGCVVHPCSIFSCVDVAETVTIVSEDGQVSIDVPVFGSLGPSANLLSIGVSTNPASTEPLCCWEIVAHSPNNFVKFPIRYGHDVGGMKVTSPAMELKKRQRYRIYGHINYFKNGELRAKIIRGEFVYDAGPALPNK
jgi:hypothetical protein